MSTENSHIDSAENVDNLVENITTSDLIPFINLNIEEYLNDFSDEGKFIIKYLNHLFA